MAEHREHRIGALDGDLGNEHQEYEQMGGAHYGRARSPLPLHFRSNENYLHVSGVIAW